MVIAVTGGTGFLGAHTVARLVAAGARVRMLARVPDRLPPASSGVTPDAVEVVPGDVTDAAAVARLVSGATAVVHVAGVYTFDSRRRAELRRVNVAGTETVLEAARSAGVARIVHVSTVGALYPAAGSIGPATEPGTSREPYLAAKAAAERIARRHRDEGVPVTIVYPPALLGPEDPRLGDQNARLRDLLRGLMPFWPSGGLPIGDVRDTAAQLAAVLLAPGPVEPAYFGPGHFVTTRGYLDLARAATGRRLPAVFLPPALLAPVGRLGGLLQRVWPWHVPAEYGAIHVCAVATPVEGGAPDAGVPARAPLATVRDAAAWLHGAGLLTDWQAGAAARPTDFPAAPGKAGSTSTQEVVT
jgi:nucleoside-diphosphate-sugar epimerase